MRLTMSICSKRRLHGVRALRLHGHPHRPELPAHLARAQARDVGHQGRPAAATAAPRYPAVRSTAAEVALEALADLPGQVVVTVDQRRRRQNALPALAAKLSGGAAAAASDSCGE